MAKTARNISLCRAYTIESVGVTGKPGEWSYNVAGSPDWDELFTSVSGVQLSEDAAKNLWAANLAILDAAVVEGELSLHDIHSAYVDLYEDRERYRVLGEAYGRLKEGLERTYGIDVQNAPGAYTDAYFVADVSGRLESPGQWETRRAELEGLLNKLKNMPAELRAGDNHAPYDQAVKDACTLQDAVRYAARSFEAEGVDPATIPTGKPPRFGAAYEVRIVDEDRYLWSAGGEPREIRKLYFDEFLLGGSYLLTTGAANNAACRGGTISVQLVDPETSEQTSNIDIPCFVSGTGAYVSKQSRPEDAGHPFVEVYVKERPDRKFQRTVTCTICGKERRRTGTATEYFNQYYSILSDLSVQKGRSYSDTYSNTCPGFTLCRRN